MVTKMFLEACIKASIYCGKITILEWLEELGISTTRDYL